MTKKIAKHTAAEILLKKYMRNYDEDDEAMDYSDEEGAEMHGDYITRLMDFCVMKNFFKPEFECINSYGPSHEPVFTFQCRLSSIKKNADAENKKLAKQLSAKKMLDEIMVVSARRKNICSDVIIDFRLAFRAIPIWRRRLR